MILRARRVLPIDRPPIADGFVEVATDRITRVGRASDLTRTDECRDLGDCILTPGLVNCHSHLELGAYHRQLDPAPFWDWVLQLVSLRRAADAPARERAAVATFARRSLRHGITCVGDISRSGQAWRALADLPIRKVCFAELITFAQEPPRSPDELAAALAAVDEDDLLTAGLSPHAPYSVSPAHSRAAIAHAARIRRPWTMHWAETREERAFLHGDAHALPAAIRDLQLRCGITPPPHPLSDYVGPAESPTPPGLLVHANYVDDAECREIARRRLAVAHCPRAHRFFGHAEHPLPRLLAAGVPVAIGTDSPASNDDVDLLGELRTLRARLGHAAPPADRLLRMVTLDAAAALGLAAKTGSLTPGKAADIAAFPCDDPDATDPADWLIANGGPATGVWVNGRDALDAAAPPAYE